MLLDPFDENDEQREIRSHDEMYERIFLMVRDHVESCGDALELLHIGSTAVPGLRGKPMIDILAISDNTDLRAEQEVLERLGFHRRSVWVDSDDKPYVCASVQVDGRRYNVNVHICHRNDPLHRESLEFIRILGCRPDLRKRYEDAKIRAHAIAPADAEAYNRQKESVIREILLAEDRSD